MKLTKDRWVELEIILDEALNYPSEKRDAYLHEVCRGNPSLRKEVETLLLDARDTSSFLEGRALPFALPFLYGLTSFSEEENALMNHRIGSYRLLQEIGRGGMGVVYRAERIESPFEHEVAIKLIPSGRHSEALIRRFEQEQRVLASLNHPNIARLYDGGITADDQPYFIMEYVEGQVLTTYCDIRQLSIDARLKLFQTVASAVQYAHQNLVIHRDLKPSNILVTEKEDIKLLDFGIAKLLSGDDSAQPKEMVTRTGERWMTPDYAAPEQIQGKNITTATDVYQLGMVLYQLLTGRRPYPVNRGSIYELEKAICEMEPIRPSIVVTQAKSFMTEGEATSVEDRSREHYARVKHIQNKLKGDIDAIVLKALQKEPDQRYASAEAFVEDIKRYQTGLAVKAQRRSLSYQVGKFVKRNVWSVATAAVFIVLLVGYTLTVIIQQRQIIKETAKSEQMLTYLIDLFKFADPSEARGSTITVQELFETGSRTINNEFEDMPDVQAALMNLMGKVYWSIGLYDKSQDLLESSLRIRRDLFSNPHPDLAASINDLAETLRTKGEYDSARPLYEEALSIIRRLPNAGMQEAEILSNQALFYKQIGQDSTAEVLYQEALAVYRDKRLGDHENFAATLYDLAILWRNQGKLWASDSLLSEVLTMQKRLYAGEHWRIATTMNILGSVRSYLGQDRIADSLYLQALAMQEKILGEHHMYLAPILTNLGRLRQKVGKLDEARSFYERALSIRINSLGGEHQQVAVGYSDLGALLRRMGAFKEAEAMYRRSLDIYEKIHGKEHHLVGNSLTSIALALHGQKDFRGAESYYLAAMGLLRESTARTARPWLTDALLNYGRLLMDQNRFRDALPFLRQTLVLRLEIFEKENRWTAIAHGMLGRCLIGLQQFEQAESHLLSSFQVLNNENTLDRTDTLESFVALYEAWGKPQEAVPYQKLLNDA